MGSLRLPPGLSSSENSDARAGPSSESLGHRGCHPGFWRQNLGCGAGESAFLRSPFRISIGEGLF